MTVYLYAVSDASACAPDCAGLRGEALEMVRAAGLAALTSNAPSAPAAAEEDLWQHEQVVETMMREHDVLPARFGTVLENSAAVERLLAERAEEFAAALERVAGSVELGVRAALDRGTERAPGGTVGARSGTEYLLQAKSRDSRAAELIERLERELSPLAKDRLIQRGHSPVDPVRVAYLVERSRVEPFLERSAQVAAETDYAELVCTGPWPPYSFVGGEQEG